MGLKVAVQMDPIESIDIKGDSTFAQMLEAQNRGATLFFYHPNTLALENGILQATGKTVTVKDEADDYYKIIDEKTVNLNDFDVVLMRQDPPFDMHYITATHLLEQIHPKTLVVNDPAHVRNAPEKLFILRYPQFMPPTLITRDTEQLRKFRDEHKDIIIKPLYGNGGAGVFRLMENDQNFSSLVEMFHESYREPFIAQKFLSDVTKGDKRIILVDGEVAGAINRVPAKGETRSNMHVGGKPVATELTEREYEICAALKDDLKSRGLIFVGIDVIGDYMTEINVTSPTGIREVKNFGGNDIAAMIWDSIEQKLANQS